MKDNQKLNLHDYWLLSVFMRRDIGDEQNFSPMLSKCVNITMTFLNDYGQSKAIIFEQCRDININFPCSDIRHWSVYKVKTSSDGKNFTFLFEDTNAQVGDEPFITKGEERISFRCNQWRWLEPPIVGNKESIPHDLNKKK
jgi:hypothetical protein